MEADAGSHGREALAARSGSAEEKVQAACREALFPVFPRGLAVYAVGGFGRRELFPFSDVDVMLLVETTPTRTQEKEAISRFVQLVWDAGLRLSHSVHTAEECATLNPQNVELTISLLDRRLICGDEVLAAKLEQQLTKFLQSQGTEIIRHLCAMARGRHRKYHDTIYHLEPNIKESPGGLRDLQTVRWLGMLQSNAVEMPLEAASGFLFDLRSRLHERFKRDNNVLGFEAQDDLSEHPTDLMREYFFHARAIHRCCLQRVELSEEKQPSLLAQFRDWRSRISNSDFTVVRDRGYLRAPQQLTSDPKLAFRFCTWLARHGLRLSFDATRRLEEFAATQKDLDTLLNWADWQELLRLPKPTAGLRALHDTGLLAALIPEWKQIECLVVRDFYHRYTVDEHTMVTVETLDSLEDRRFAELFTEIPEPAILRFALLLHDIGKGSGGEHVEGSLKMAAGIFDRLGMPEADRDTIRFLIEKHLDLSQVMTARDLDDVHTGELLAARVGTIERLKTLTLLTFADITAVNPTTMTPWRKEQLWRAYLLGHDELTRELDRSRIHIQEAASPEMKAFLEGFPVRYQRTHSEAEIRAHLDLATLSRLNVIGIDLQRQSSGVYRLTLVTADKPYLFASIAGVLASFGLNILKAEAFANAQGLVLDTFMFVDPLRTLELNPPEVDRLRGVVSRVVRGRSDLNDLLKSRPRPKPPSRRAQVQPQVSFNDDASPACTLIEIVAQDRPGLLYDVSRTLSNSGCSIEVVLIDTEAHKALDVFYVTSGRAKVPLDLQTKLKGELLTVCAAG